MAPSGPALLLGVLLTLSTALTEDMKINKLVGEEIRLVPVFDGVPLSFEWRKGPDKVIEVDFPNNPQKYALFTNRSDFNDSTGALAIRDLQLTDMGEYSAHVLINGSFKITSFQLHVYPALKKPTVNCTDTDAGVVIWCRHDPDPPTYEWSNGGQPASSNLHNSSFADQNRTFTVGPADWISLQSLECVVKNPATENRISVPESCFKKDSRGRLRNGLIPALVLALLLTLLMIYGIYDPEASYLQRCVNFVRKRIHGLIDQISNWFHGYQTTATNDQGLENQKGEENSSTDEQSDNRNKGIPTKESESLSATQPAIELLQTQKSQMADGDGSADEGATSAPKFTADSDTNPTGKKLVKESQNQHDAPPLQSKESSNSEAP